MKKILTIILLSLSLQACQVDNEQTELIKTDKVVAIQNISDNKKSTIQPLTSTVNEAKLMKSKKTMIEYQGTIHFLNLEGGFYGIITEKGEKLLPMNLAKEYQKPGAVVKVKGEFVDVMTIQQWGKPFKITEIKILELKNIENPSF